MMSFSKWYLILSSLASSFINVSDMQIELFGQYQIELIILNYWSVWIDRPEHTNL